MVLSCKCLYSIPQCRRNLLLKGCLWNRRSLFFTFNALILALTYIPPNFLLIYSTHTTQSATQFKAQLKVHSILLVLHPLHNSKVFQSITFLCIPLKSKLNSKCYDSYDFQNCLFSQEIRFL